jgi:hypothetical protein
MRQPEGPPLGAAGDRIDGGLVYAPGRLPLPVILKGFGRTALTVMVRPAPAGGLGALHPLAAHVADGLLGN